ncbi:hypothetical protein [Candidatus Igneacidithiobacillus taiwanensis]|uniref:hypothetical protein n=1 Tax=Candidatus Igneacidithiobacillus taiwanensis TaxID=1945924 RepID=UPI00289EF1B6|nr:hypothetical protein [Candidatus Igneacidithiobacillus taiwanensis]MCE5359604.1 hypothetical protein [Acidithiobacillus sp.]
MVVPELEAAPLTGTAVYEYLLYLQASGGAVALSDLRGKLHCMGRLSRLSRQGVTIFCRDLHEGVPEILVAHYEPNRSVHFLLSQGREEEPGSWCFPYPPSIQVRQERRHLRYTLSAAVLASWSSSCSAEAIRGDVVDIGLGGFLASIYVSSEQLVDTVSCREGARGVVTLRRDDGREWVGEAELRRRVPLAPPSEEKNETGSEFVLLGFAFQFEDSSALNDLTDFFQGILGPIA